METLRENRVLEELVRHNYLKSNTPRVNEYEYKELKHVEENYQTNNGNWISFYMNHGELWFRITITLGHDLDDWHYSFPSVAYDLELLESFEATKVGLNINHRFFFDV